MAARRSASLLRRNPHRLDVPLLLFVTAALLTFGLTTPALETRTLILWRDEYSILHNIQQLYHDDKLTAACILAACSVVYPATKLALLWFFWLLPFPASWRMGSIRLIRLLGRWCMVDVLTITAIVLASLSIGPLKAEPKIGLYLYAAGVLCLMFVGLLIDRLARRSATSK